MKDGDLQGREVRAREGLWLATGGLAHGASLQGDLEGLAKRELNLGAIVGPERLAVLEDALEEARG